MIRHFYPFMLPLLLIPVVGFAREVPGSDFPPLTTVPELRAAFDRLLYEQKFAEGREALANWQPRKEHYFGEVAVAAAYLFEEFEFPNPISNPNCIRLPRIFKYLAVPG